MKYCTYISRHPTAGWFYLGKGQTAKVMSGYKGSGKLILKAFKKYPKHEWNCSILQTYELEKDAYEAEKLLITKEVIAQPKCLNIQEGGREVWTAEKPPKGHSKTKGRPLTEEHKAKVGKAAKEVWSRPGQREALSQKMLGHKKPPGHGEKISKLQKARWEDPAFREKMSQKLKDAWVKRRGAK